MRIKKEVVVFLLLVTLLNMPFYINFKFSIPLFWTPAVAALLTNIYFNRNIENLGWRCGRIKYLLFGVFLPIIYGAIIYGALIFSGASVLHEESLGWLAKSNGIQTLFAVHIFRVFMCSLGEEIGWRGFLAPRLVKLTGFINGGVANGLIWSFWHYPMMFIGKFVGEPNVPLPYCIVSFTLTAVGFGVLLTWLRIRSNSIWPGVLLHASHNITTKLFFLPLIQPSGVTAYIAGLFGGAFAVVGLIFILVIKTLKPAGECQQCQK